MRRSLRRRRRVFRDLKNCSRIVACKRTSPSRNREKTDWFGETRVRRCPLSRARQVSTDCASWKNGSIIDEGVVPRMDIRGCVWYRKGWPEGGGGGWEGRGSCIVDIGQWIVLLLAYSIADKSRVFARSGDQRWPRHVVSGQNAPRASCHRDEEGEKRVGR